MNGPFYFLNVEHQLSQLEKQLISCNAKLTKYEKNLLDVKTKLEQRDEYINDVEKKYDAVRDENRNVTEEIVSFEDFWVLCIIKTFY